MGGDATTSGYLYSLVLCGVFTVAKKGGSDQEDKQIVNGDSDSRL